MALLDSANTGTYVQPEVTKVNIGFRNNPCILVSGHDLKDLNTVLDKYLDGADYTAALVQNDGNFITGKGPGAAMDFSFAIAEKYVGADKVKELKQAMMIAE